VIPKWLTDVLPGDGDFGVERMHDPENGDRSENRWSASALNLTARCVCACCNHGWMSTLEQDAAPLLIPMINGRATSLSRDDQTVLARWLMKTVGMCEQAIPGDAGVIPAAWHRTLFLSQTPPPGVWAWLGRYAGGEFRPGATRAAQWYIHPLQLDSSRGIERGLSTVLSLGQLVFQLLAVFVDDPAAIAATKGEPFLQLWPDPIYRAPWPPAAAPLDDAALEALALSFTR
jgi:hypothetical protein